MVSPFIPLPRSLLLSFRIPPHLLTVLSYLFLFDSIKDIFYSIKKEELFHAAWNHKEREHISPNVIVFIGRFEQVLLLSSLPFPPSLPPPPTSPPLPLSHIPLFASLSIPATNIEIGEQMDPWYFIKGRKTVV